MHAALLILASESERSETPFYIAGVLFACWAIFIGVSGLRSESFGSTAANSRTIIIVSVLAMLACMGIAVYVSN
jgi:hypothetical protein